MLRNCYILTALFGCYMAAATIVSRTTAGEEVALDSCVHKKQSWPTESFVFLSQLILGSCSTHQLWSGLFHPQHRRLKAQEKEVASFTTEVKLISIQQRGLLYSRQNVEHISTQQRGLLHSQNRRLLHWQQRGETYIDTAKGFASFTEQKVASLTAHRWNTYRHSKRGSLHSRPRVETHFDTAKWQKGRFIYSTDGCFIHSTAVKHTSTQHRGVLHWQHSGETHINTAKRVASFIAQRWNIHRPSKGCCFTHSTEVKYTSTQQRGLLHSQNRGLLHSQHSGETHIDTAKGGCFTDNTTGKHTSTQQKELLHSQNRGLLHSQHSSETHIDTAKGVASFTAQRVASFTAQRWNTSTQQKGLLHWQHKGETHIDTAKGVALLTS